MRGAGGGMKPGFTPTGGATAMAGRGGKTDFVICEICDGYIKDLEQLRNHMLWIHKVSFTIRYGLHAMICYTLCTKQFSAVKL